MTDLSLSVTGIRFPNPVLTAAGPNVINARLMTEAAEGGAGGIVAKTFSAVPARDPRPTIRSAHAGGLVNCETWSEMDVDAFLHELFLTKAALREKNLPLIVSLGYSAEDVARLIRLVEKEIRPEGFEFSTHYTGGSLDPLVAVAAAARKATDLPVWMKLSPGFPDLPALVKAAEPHVDAFVAVNSYGPVLDFDIESGMPKLGSGNGCGWLSGPPLLPIALRIVHLVSTLTEKPVIGVGGIEKGGDAVKHLMAGASLVQICSAAIKKGSGVYGKVARELGDYLDQHKTAGGLQGLRGLYGRRLREAKATELGEKACIRVDEAQCTRCGACITRCVQTALSLGGSYAGADPARCIGCGFCIDFCNFSALRLEKIS